MLCLGATRRLEVSFCVELQISSFKYISDIFEIVSDNLKDEIDIEMECMASALLYNVLVRRFAL